ncbi:MAG: hypothetical protein Tsb0034_06060 [Ekhidna sp.]
MNDEVKSAVRLIKQGEGQFVEFKKKANHPEKIVREVVAFANAGGGNLFVGVDDNGTISGLSYPEDDEFVLTRAITELCRPKVDFEVQELKVKSDTVILHYRIKEGNKKPYFAFLDKNHKYGKAFVRVSDRSIQASYEMRQILKRSSGSGEPIVFEEKTRELFNYFKSHPSITLKEYTELSGMNKKLASNKLISLALSGALKIEPKEGGDIFSPTE